MARAMADPGPADPPSSPRLREGFGTAPPSDGAPGNKQVGEEGGYPKPGNLAEDSSLISCTCIFLESNPYFIEDVFQKTESLKQLRYLLGLAQVAADRLAADPKAEVLDVDGALCDLASEAAKHWSNKDLRRAMIETTFKLKAFFLKEETSPVSSEVLQSLARLQFVDGPISVFNVHLPRAVDVHGLTAASHKAILDAYATFVRTERALRNQPDVWTVNGLFVRCAVTCAVHYSNQGDLYFLMIWKGNEIRFVGGDIIHQKDKDLLDAARREFLEEPGEEPLDVLRACGL